MQSVYMGFHPGVPSADMLSFIDLNPLYDDCMYSALCYIIEQAKSFMLPSICIMFDKPLFVKTPDMARKVHLDNLLLLWMDSTLL